MGGFVRNITGQTAAKRAGREAAAGQQRATDQSLATLERLNQPFIDLGTQGIEQFQPFLQDPSGASFLQSNPMFQAALDYTGDQLKGAGAAAGKFNSGGMVNQLFQNYMATGNDLINSAFNRALQPVALGQNAASLQGNNISNLLTGNANAQGAATMAAGMLPSQTFNNLVQAGSSGAGMAIGLSDERAKDILEQLGEDEKGRIVRFRYKGSDDIYEGRIAQDLQKTDPDHVFDVDGVLHVSDKYMPTRVS